MDGRSWNALNQNDTKQALFDEVILSYTVRTEAFICISGQKWIFSGWQETTKQACTDQKKLVLPDQKGVEAASPILPPTCWGSRPPSSWRTTLFFLPDCTHWPVLWRLEFSLCQEGHKTNSPWRRKNGKDFYFAGRTMSGSSHMREFNRHVYLGGWILNLSNTSG